MTKIKSEKYSGVKFKTVFLGDFLPSAQEKKIINDLMAVGKKIGQLGIRDRNGGNFSVKTKNGLIIKRTGACLYRLKINDFVLINKINREKVFVFGQKEPSSEARLHWFVYQSRPEIRCVLHCHDFLAVRTRKRIKGIGYVRNLPYGTFVLAQAVSQKAKNFNYLILENHGVVALGRNIKNAFNLVKKYHERFKKIV